MSLRIARKFLRIQSRVSCMFQVSPPTCVTVDTNSAIIFPTSVCRWWFPWLAQRTKWVFRNGETNSSGWCFSGFPSKPPGKNKKRSSRNLSVWVFFKTTSQTKNKRPTYETASLKGPIPSTSSCGWASACQVACCMFHRRPAWFSLTTHTQRRTRRKKT